MLHYSVGKVISSFMKVWKNYNIYLTLFTDLTVRITVKIMFSEIFLSFCTAFRAI